MKINRELRIRIVTAIIYVAIMITFIVPGLWVPSMTVLLCTVVTFLTGLEKSKAVKLRFEGVSTWFVAVASVFAGLLGFLGIDGKTFLRGLSLTVSLFANTFVALRIVGYFALILLLLLPLVGLVRMWRRGADMYLTAVAETVLIISTALPLVSVIALLYGIKCGWHWLVLAVLTAWISDTAAYFVGKLFGRMKFSPALSPNKTWEGTIGGIGGTIILYLIYFPLVIGKRMGFTTGISLAFAVIAAVFMSTVSTLGDIRSSALKRWCGIKDFGSLLPGHGGVSDRFDSLSTAMPAMLLLSILSQFFV
ncbi:MAG TPA: phosphatidate cytidylyltransferase [Clostridiaceae bacterium]|nr:phosphatidate cytidylyltransferase [Clostridiaceae bacterium]